MLSEAIAILLIILGVIAYFAVIPKSKKFLIQNEVALITGGASGIGLCLAHLLVSAGNTVILLDINKNALVEAREKLKEIQQNKENIKVFSYVCDVSNPDDVKQTLKKMKVEIYPKTVSILVNNAGIVHGKKLLDLSVEEIQKTFKVNILSHFWTVQNILPDMMQKNKGLIVSISSIMSLASSTQLSDYCSSKWAVNGLHESIRLELIAASCDGVHTLLVCPYAIKTGMFDGVFESNKCNQLIKTLFPLLSPDIVAKEIFESMKNGDHVLIGCSSVGWHKLFYRFTFFLLRLLPINWMDAVLSFAGSLHGMEAFRGRK